MSQEDVETVRHFSEAFNRRDVEALRAVVHRQADFDGYEGLDEWAAHWWAGEFVAYVEIEQLIDTPDAVVAAIVLETHSHASGETTERHHIAAVFEFRDGKVSKWSPHPSRARAFEAVGLRE